MSWPSGCRPRLPRRSTWARRSEETNSLYGLDRKETKVFGQNCVCWRGDWSSGIRFVQLYRGAGASVDAHTRGSRRTTRRPLPRHRPAGGRPCSKTSRPAGYSTKPWSSGVVSSAAPRCPRRGRPRPQPQRLHHVDGRRRDPRGRGRSGTTDESRTPRGRRQAPRPRSARHDPAPDGRRPHEARLPPQGTPRAGHHLNEGVVSEKLRPVEAQTLAFNFVSNTI